MSAYRKVFEKKHAFLAVVHAETLQQVTRNVAIAKDNGADGAFLINHLIPGYELVYIYANVKKKFPGFWLGMNLLDKTPMQAVGSMPDNECGLWVDNAGIRNESIRATTIALSDYRQRESSWKGLYFGGVAFKGQEEISDPARAAVLAMHFVDVVTTSGIRTGSAPDVKKIRSMKRAIGDFPLAIASGITFDNVADYLEWCDCFLVATGICDSDTELNPILVRRLAYRLAP